ncbi:MAG: DUF4383 domain-containing protein [Ilumatobacteraceae bacterium]
MSASEVGSKARRDVSRSVLRVFGPTLIVTGLLGFVVPQRKALTSGAPAYNIFHLVFGSLGIACAASRRRGPARAFNIGFGAIDLYQAVASRRGWSPQRWFRWKAADDVLHVGIGAALVIAGLCGSPTEPAER